MVIDPFFHPWIVKWLEFLCSVVSWSPLNKWEIKRYKSLFRVKMKSNTPKITNLTKYMFLISKLILQLNKKQDKLTFPFQVFFTRNLSEKATPKKLFLVTNPVFVGGMICLLPVCTFLSTVEKTL